MALDNQKKNPSLSGEPASPQAPSRGERQKVAQEYQEKIKEALSHPAKPLAETKSQPLAKKAREAGSLSGNLDYPKIREAVLKELQNLSESLRTVAFKKAPVAEPKKDQPKAPRLPANRDQPLAETVKKIGVVKEKITSLLLNFVNSFKNYFAKKKIFPKIPVKPKAVAPLLPAFKRPIKIPFKFRASFKRPLLILFFTVIILFIVVSCGIYLGGWDQPAAKVISKIIPYPVLYVDGKIIYARDFFDDLSALKKYLSRQGLPVNNQEIKKRILESLVEKAVLEKLARDKNISVSQEKVQAETDMILETAAGQAEAQKLIGDLYGWTLTVYQEKIIRPVLLARELEAAYYQSGDFSQLKKQLSDYRDQLLKTPEKFSDIAGQINEDATKFVGGDLGWFSLGDMVPEFESAVLDLKEGELSEVFESRFGFHLVKLEEKVMEAGQPTFHAAHLFLKRAPFNDYLAEQIKKAKVLTLIKI